MKKYLKNNKKAESLKNSENENIKIEFIFR